MGNLARFALIIGAATLFGGCGGSQVPLGAPGTMPVSAVHSQKIPTVNEPRGTSPVEFVYVANHNSDDLSAYVVDAGTGTLSPIDGSPFATGYGPLGVAIDPSGKFAYVANNGTVSGKPGSVSAFTINPRSGALTPVQGSPFAAGSNPLAVAVSPTEKYLYVVNFASGNLSIFTINARTGSLKQIKQSPRRTHVSPTAEAIDPTGNWIYVTHEGKFPWQDDGAIAGYTISTHSGALRKLKGRNEGTDYLPVSVTIDPSGKFVYVANFAGQTVTAYAIGASTGTLSPVQGSPFYTDYNPGGVAIDPNGSFAYVVADLDVDAYTITSDGALTPVEGSPFAGGYEPDGAAVDPLGKFLYVANTNPDNNVSAYAINPSNGALTQVQGSPFAAGQNPAGIATCEIEHDRCVPPTL